MRLPASCGDSAGFEDGDHGGAATSDAADLEAANAGIAGRPEEFSAPRTAVLLPGAAVGLDVEPADGDSASS